jgi:hypothetical protein
MIQMISVNDYLELAVAMGQYIDLWFNWFNYVQRLRVTTSPFTSNFFSSHKITLMKKMFIYRRPWEVMLNR